MSLPPFHNSFITLMQEVSYLFLKSSSARAGHGDVQLSVHGGPGRAQEGVGQAQADEGQIDNGQEQGHEKHLLPLKCKVL